MTISRNTENHNKALRQQWESDFLHVNKAEKFEYESHVHVKNFCDFQL